MAGYFDFPSLPAEIREQVYGYLLNSEVARRELEDGYHRYDFDLSILYVSRQIYYEARKVFKTINVFARIETPWTEAQQHVSIEGHVPILCSGQHADQFEDHTLGVSIDSPRYTPLTAPAEKTRFVVLAEDLPAFCKSWFYSDLGYPSGLNQHLRLTLRLRNFHAPEQDDRPVPKHLQRKLLMPFGLVKGLSECSVEGQCYGSVEKAMREEMAVPYVSPEQCLEDSTKLIGKGDEASKKGHYSEALGLYFSAFEAMHIICVGHRRSVEADAYFDKQLDSGMYKYQYGQGVRLILRVRLVANVVHTYLKLEDWEEARFWSMRTINLIRENMGIDEQDEPFFSSPVSDEVGNIYFGAGVAFKQLGKPNEARKLLKVAAGYLPNDETVRMELASVEHAL